MARLPNSKSKGYVETLIDASTDALRKSKRCISIERKAVNFKVDQVVSQNDYDTESTSVVDASVVVSKTSTRYAFTPFFSFTFYIFEFDYLMSDLIIWVFNIIIYFNNIFDLNNVIY